MKKPSVIFLSFILLAGCSDIADRDFPTPEPAPAAVTDPQATVQTARLLANLRTTAESGRTLFGHQCSSLYGIGWSGDSDRSDVKSICGDYPALMGWDIGAIESGGDSNLDGDRFDDIRMRILESYARGGVTTIGWHTTNPVTGGTAWDTTPAVARIIPGGDLHDLYRGWLDRVAGFLASLCTADGVAVPVLFRPFHEHTGNGFWWGKGNCTAAEYVSLWRFTLEYLRDVRGCHNLLWVYSPDIVGSQDAYLEFWPGDEYVDILGLDAYDRTSWSLATDGVRLMRLLRHISHLRNKPFAFTETGIENNTAQPAWWTGTLLKTIESIPAAYVLVWRNKDSNHFFGPYPGCVSEEDFRKFVATDRILTEKDIAGIYE